MNELSERVNQLRIQAEGYFNDPFHINPLPYLIARRDQKYYQLTLAQDLEGNRILERLVQEYLVDLTVDSAAFGVYDWDTENPEQCILFKRFMDAENDFYNKLSEYEECDRERFLRKRYPLRFFSLELPLDTTQSIHLHQYISNNYQTSWKLHWNLFEDLERIKIINNSTGFTIDKSFDFLSFVDKTDSSQCFSVIYTRKWFEKLHDYVKRYEEAYRVVSNLDCVDFSVLGTGTEDAWRKCFSLLKYPDLNRCVSALNSELLSGEQTISKDVLAEKGIQFEMRAGVPVVIPETVNQLKVVIKMLSDKIVLTQYLQRLGLSDYIDEIHT